MILTFDPSSLSDYETFLRVKSLPIYDIRGRTAWFPDEYAETLGLVPQSQIHVEPSLADHLFDYQRAGAALAIKKRKFALFWRPGLGKTLPLLEHVKHARKVLPSEKRCLIVSPLMVIEQTLEEAFRWYPEMIIERVAAKDLPAWMHGNGGIGITNYEAMTERVERGNLGLLDLDEACFARGTMVDVVENDRLAQKPIENISKGDTIVNASGFDTVAETSVNEVPYAIAVTAGKRIVVSPNHRFFTVRGWVRADGLKPGDSVLSPSTAMRVLRGDVPIKGHARIVSFLRNVLLSEMANEQTGDSGQSALQRSAKENRGCKEALVCCREREGRIRAGENSEPESDVSAGSSSESIGDHETTPMQTNTGRQWQADAAIAADALIRTGGSLFSRIPNNTGKAKTGISDVLQGGLGISCDETCDRTGWKLPSSFSSQVEGREENGDAEFARVDSVEVLESGHHELDQFRDADGKLYFYDIEATRHPSYSVSGLLVHNSLLKSHYGKWGQVILRLGRGLDWKLCLTGTPAPNDRIEYANHAVFLDHFPTVNSFLARYFVNRGETNERWELKPHALEAFYRSMSHWALFISDPGIYGWKDNNNSFPPIRVHIDHLEMSTAQQSAYRKLTGNLVVANPGGIAKRSAVARLGKGREKFEFICDLIDSWKAAESTIVWCRYNDEQDAMHAMLPDAGNIDGRTPHEERQRIIHEFKAGRIRTIISKPKIMQFGLNLQIATRHVWSGLQDSYEEFFQGCCRSNRIGSTKPLDVHIPCSDLERPMIENVLRKSRQVESDIAEQERIFRKESMACQTY